jgi:hypothetical protein
MVNRKHRLGLLALALVMAVGIAGFAHAMDVTLAWDPNGESDLAGYKIYYGTTSGGPYNSTVSSNGQSPIIVPANQLEPSSPQFTVLNLPNGTYYFVVTAYNTAGLESGYSNQVSASSSATRYQLSARVASGSGTISPTSGTYDAGTVVTLTATPASGYRVSSWTGTNNNNSTSTTNTVTMSSNRSVTVSFIAVPNTAPTISSLEVSGQSGSTAVYTNTRNVSVRIVASDDVLVSQYLILDGNSDPSAGVFSTIPGGARQNPIFTVSDFALNNADGSRTIYAWVKDDQGVVSAAASKANVVLDRVAPTVTGFPVINYADPSMTVTYSESNMKNAALASNYTFNNGLALAGNGSDTSGNSRAFRFPLNPGTLQPYVIYTLQISGSVTDAAGNAVSPNSIRVNDNDNDGMADDWEIRWFGSITAKNGNADSDGDGLTDREEYTYARNNPGWGAGRWTLNPLNADSDGDGIPDYYEALNGLNPVNASDRDLDLDQDGWTNYEEYLYGSAANDPNSRPEPRNSIEVTEVLPVSDKGLEPGEKGVQENTGFSIRIDSLNGMDLGDSNAVTLTVTDGTRTYTRRLNELNGVNQRIVQAVPMDADGNIAYDFWAVYYRTNETTIPKNYPSGSVVEVSVQAKDRMGEIMVPLAFRFKIQGEEEKNALQAALPVTSIMVGPISATKTVTVESGPLKGASLFFADTLVQEIGVEPYFGPVEDIPPLTGVKALGAPLNLLPEMVFPSPVTVLIPCPGYDDVSDLDIYYYDGRNWWLACNKDGNVTADGEGWMVPGSRVNHNRKGGGYIEIQVNHFSAVSVAGTSPTTSVSVESAGGSCFISSLWR